MASRDPEEAGEGMQTEAMEGEVAGLPRDAQTDTDGKAAVGFLLPEPDNKMDSSGAPPRIPGVTVG